MAKASTKRPTLWGLHYSPWTEKARWALDVNEVDYRYREHLPMIGELPLRWHTRSRDKGVPASVPLLLDEAGSHGDSEQIARRAELLGKGFGLFPEGGDATLAEWTERAQAALEHARALVIHATTQSDLAQIESLPPAVPSLMRRSMRGVARRGARFLARKYGADPSALDEHERALQEFCSALAKALARGDHLIEDRLSYADMVCAVAVNAMNPPAHLFRHKPATRGVWTREAIVEAHPEVFAWRDRLYARHRGL
ncbi:hypothetical protein PPSIR1_04453 [Plesiocystis pacifica SIR-1]|uniref:GST N-terminal domain-containing protein n=1 Tax=Plesiocystis pacifica SIR-1 TaxID=391625 RepID=A6GBC0_9BACT|nr:glutathione S-transferase C-terminal domain-containing protein [Plesiocystis pacifica]EDM76829.1 hypothetical protein PPSIR1_04453 [Plesiocystis pacifica SIR-1]